MQQYDMYTCKQRIMLMNFEENEERTLQSLLTSRKKIPLRQNRYKTATLLTIINF
jgi:hypothetical protein